jgi:hypothetical protein
MIRFLVFNSFKKVSDLAPCVGACCGVINHRLNLDLLCTVNFLLFKLRFLELEYAFKFTFYVKRFEILLFL